jgi:host factor-I protein
MINWHEGLMYRGASECSCSQGAEEIGMDSKPAQNIQDSFLNTARKERLNITIYLLSGVKLTGRIRSFDKYSVVLETNNQEQLIFKHAISTIAMGRTIHGHTDKPTVMPSSSSPPAGDSGSAAAAASGTEG